MLGVEKNPFTLSPLTLSAVQRSRYSEPRESLGRASVGAAVVTGAAPRWVPGTGSPCGSGVEERPQQHCSPLGSCTNVENVL